MTRRAFTLVELLVVIAIIGVLVDVCHCHLAKLSSWTHSGFVCRWIETISAF